MPSTCATEPLLDVRDLTVRVRTPGTAGRLAVAGMSFRVPAGGALALVGENGSGKTLAARALLGVPPPGTAVTGGQVLFGGVDLLRLPPGELRRIRGRRIAMVFQNPAEALNPTVPLGRQLTEHLRWHRICGRAEARDRAVQALHEVGMPEPERWLRRYPCQLSAGMRQRVLIAIATVTRPELLIADEATTGLDTEVRRRVLDVFRKLNERGTALILITHDRAVARYACRDVAVVRAGRIAGREDPGGRP